MTQKFLVPKGRAVSVHFLYYRLVLNLVSSEKKAEIQDARKSIWTQRESKYQENGMT
jgi:hypothetical protein